MTDEDELEPPAAESDAELGRRAQILATEHWGLLAARGTAQSEVLTRITIFLTLVSAALVTIGLLGQATRFTDWFPTAALSILGFVLIVGVLTQVRVFNVADEDMMFVVAMNRLRGAYVDLDPKVEQYFLAATADDQRGMRRTYSFLRDRSDASQVLGSSAVLIAIVNASVLGLLTGGIAAASGAPASVDIVVGIVLGLAMVIGSTLLGYRGFRASWDRYIPRRRTEKEPPHLR